MKTSFLIASSALFVFAFSPAPPASAQAPKDFYQNKSVELVISDGVGGGSDTMGRLMGRYIGRYLPGNPLVVIKNMPGAGGLAGANYLYNIAAKDGSAFGMVEQSLHLTQIFKTKGLLADVRRFNWLGRVISNNAALFAWRDRPVQKIADAFDKELVIATPGLSSQMRWTVLKRLTGMKFKLIVGHKGTSEATLAMERGEVDAVAVPWTVLRVAHAGWLRDKQVNVLLQTGIDRAADLADVPRVIDMARNDEQRQILEIFSLSEKIGRSFVAPPEAPVERVQELRSAFTTALEDPALRAEVSALDLTLDPLGGQALQSLILRAFDYAPEIVSKAEALAKLD